MSIAFRRAPDLAAQGVVFTHLFSITTITAWLILFQNTVLKWGG
jgi:predicted permease